MKSKLRSAVILLAALTLFTVTGGHVRSVISGRILCVNPSAEERTRTV
jgi:hypothetical protein